MKSRVRWWPAILFLTLALIIIGGLWLWPDLARQDRFMRTVLTAAIAAILLFLWALLASGFTLRTRGIILLAVIAGIAFARTSLRVRGVTGDLIPIVGWRWDSPPPPPPPAAIAARPADTNLPGNLAFPQFMGPNRNGIIPGLFLETNWTAHPPQELWRQPVGQAWSGFVITGPHTITLEQRGEEEAIVSYDLLTGRQNWSHQSPGKYSTTIAGEGPRSTPAISSNRVYAFGATGQLTCLDLQNGSPIWSTNAAQQFGAKLPEWAFTSAPLIHHDRLYLFVGGPNTSALACYDASTGQPLWNAGPGGPEYSAPTFAEVAGVPQILCFQTDIWGCSLTGQELWRLPWPGKYPRVSLPVIISTNELLFSSAYGVGAELIKFTSSDGKLTPERVWKSTQFKSKFGPILRHGDYLYGLDDGMLSCIEIKTGNRRWKDGRYGHGQGLLVGDVILMTTEKGELILIEPNPDALREVAKLAVFSDKTWNPPALAGEFLLIRNHLEAACYRLKLRNSPSQLSLLNQTSSRD